MALNISDFDFGPLGPDTPTALQAGQPATLAFGGGALPSGVNSTSPGKHYIEITESATSVRDEIVLISEVDESAATITFRPRNNHASGTWSIRSATAGAQEAIRAAGTRGAILIPAGDHQVDAKTWNDLDCSILGEGWVSRLLVQFDDGDVLHVERAEQATLHGFAIWRAGKGMTGGRMIILDSSIILVTSIQLAGAYIGIHCHDAGGTFSDIQIIMGASGFRVGS